MKKERHAKILELIDKYNISTQEELLTRLLDCGVEVTQATVSRDIKELRLVKTLSSKGKYRYSTGRDNAKSISSKFYSLFSDSVVSVESAQNIIVIKCITGMAQAVCAAMDTLNFSGVVGTLAGEDTILVVCKTNELADERQEEFKKLINI